MSLERLNDNNRHTEAQKHGNDAAEDREQQNTPPWHQRLSGSILYVQQCLLGRITQSVKLLLTLHPMPIAKEQTNRNRYHHCGTSSYFFISDKIKSTTYV